MTEVTYFTCPPRCDAGGSEADGGHVFDIDRDFFRCDDCGYDFTVPVREIPAACSRCGHKRPRSTGGSLFCKCGLSAMDWTLMRPEPQRPAPVIHTCGDCDIDEAEGDLIDQCDDCKRKSVRECGQIVIKGEPHDAYVTNDGAVRDGCDAGCNGKVYARGAA